MKKLPKYVAMTALAMAAAAALPSSPLFAQDRDSDRDRDRDRGRLVDRRLMADDLPREVRETIEREAKGTNHFVDKRTRGDKTRFTVHYTTDDNQRMVLRLDESGKVLEKAKPAITQPKRDYVEESDEGVQFRAITENDVPDRVIRSMDKYTDGSRDAFYHRQIRDGKTFYSVHYSDPEGERMWIRVAENGDLAEGPHINTTDGIGLAGADRNRDRDRDRPRADRDDRDRDRPESNRPAEMRRQELTGGELPDAVRNSVEKNASGGGGHKFYRETRGDEVTFLVEWDVDGKPHNLRLNEAGKVVEGLALTQEMKREELTGGQLPAEVRRSVEANAAQGGGHKYYRETQGNQVTYLIEWDLDGKPHNLRVDGSGKVVEGIALAGAKPQPQPAPGEQPIPASDDDAELAAADATSGVQNQVIGGADMPDPVRQAVDKYTQGATDHIFQRHQLEGRTMYTAHFTTAEGARHFVVLDESGQVAVEPRESRSQRGGAGVRFEVVGIDALPADVRKAMEKEAPRGTEHLFVVRTGKGGEKAYLVQFTNAKGRRMDMTIRGDGEVTAEPDAARENPFRLAKRQDRDRSERKSERQ